MLPFLLTSSFFHSTEFFVMLFVGVALLVGFIAMPAGAGPVKEFLLASSLNSVAEAGQSVPAIDVECRGDGTVLLRRLGLEGISMDGAVSARITVKGLNITVEERLTPGRSRRPGSRPTQPSDTHSNITLSSNTGIVSGQSSNTTLSPHFSITPGHSSNTTLSPHFSITPGHSSNTTSTLSSDESETETTASQAVFLLDFLAHERYYLRYESEATSTHATLSFRNTPGYHAGPTPLRK